MSILWRKEYHRCITPITFEVDWLTGIMFNQDGNKYAEVSAYMPYECKALRINILKSLECCMLY